MLNRLKISNDNWGSHLSYMPIFKGDPPGPAYCLRAVIGRTTHENGRILSVVRHLSLPLRLPILAKNRSNEAAKEYYIGDSGWLDIFVLRLPLQDNLKMVYNIGRK